MKLQNLLMAILFLFFSTEIFAGKNMIYYTKYMCDGGPNGYEYVVRGTYTSFVRWGGLGSFWTTEMRVNCDCPGNSGCSWLMIPQSMDEEQVGIEVAAQIELENFSGCIYSDGSSGTATIENLESSIDLPAYIWEVNGNTTIIGIVDVYEE